jgi:hypothetical protein
LLISSATTGVALLSLVFDMAFLLFSQAQVEKEADAAGPFAVLCRKRGLRPDSKSRPIRLLATCAVRQSTQNQNDKPHLDRLTTS